MIRSLVVAFAIAALVAPAVARADDTACIAASEQELTLRQQGKLHDALKQLAACADASCPDEVKAECTRRVAEVDAAMPTLVVVAQDGAGNDLSDVRVSVDGAPLLASLDGRPVSLDPGSHAFVFERTGQPPIEKTLILREGEKDRREVVVIGPPPPPPPVPAPPVVAPPPAPIPSSWTPRRTISLVVGVVGVAGVAVGSVFGGYAISAQSREKSDCGSAGSCPHFTQASEDYDKANQNATASTFAIGAGLALVAAGVVLWVTAPPQHRLAAGAPSLALLPTVSPGGGGLVLAGEL